jgi:hypothetical protein
MRTFMLLVVAVGALVLSVPAALATTGTNTADDITVVVSLSDEAVAGESFTVTESIANARSRGRFVGVTQTLTGPNGEAVFSIRYPVFLPARRTLAFSLTFTFPKNVPTGVYTLTLSAGAASASATTTVVASS